MSGLAGLLSSKVGLLAEFGTTFTSHFFMLGLRVDWRKIMNKYVAVTIRYSLYAPELRKSWVIGRESEESYKAELFSEKRLKQRQNFFEGVTLPSLVDLNKNRPSDVGLKVFLLTSTLLPEEGSRFLTEVTGSHDFIEVIYLKPEEVDIKAGLVSLVEGMADTDIYASVRLDDDDALSSDFIDQMNYYLRPDFSGSVVSLVKGYGCLLAESGEVIDVAEYKWRFGSAGLAYVTKKDKAVRTGTYSIYQCGDHTKTDNRFPTISDGRRNSFMRAFHGTNDSKDSFEKCVGRVLSKSEAPAILRKYGITIG